MRYAHALLLALFTLFTLVNCGGARDEMLEELTVLENQKPESITEIIKSGIEIQKFISKVKKTEEKQMEEYPDVITRAEALRKQRIDALKAKAKLTKNKRAETLAEEAEEDVEEGEDIDLFNFEALWKFLDAKENLGPEMKKHFEPSKVNIFSDNPDDWHQKPNQTTEPEPETPPEEVHLEEVPPQ